MLNVSIRKTVDQLELQTGEDTLLGRTQVWEIACKEGSQCHAQVLGQDEQTLAADHVAAASLLATVSAEEHAQARAEIERKADQQDDLTAAAAREADTPDTPVLIGFGETLPWQQAEVGRRWIDPDTVIVEADEVVTHAQPSTDQKRILEYTAVVLTTFVAIHLCAISPEELQRLVAAALLDLGLRQGQQRLLFVCDGARWIRAWFLGLGYTGKTLLLCWYHLHQRCTHQGLSMACRGRNHCAKIERGGLHHLWHGRVREAVGLLHEHRLEMKNTKALDDLVHFLEERVDYLPDYSQRQAQGLILASTCVERMNDLVVSQRCKGRGMSWHEVVHALASLAAERWNQPWHHIQETVLAMAA